MGWWPFQWAVWMWSPYFGEFNNTDMSSSISVGLGATEQSQGGFMKRTEMLPLRIYGTQLTGKSVCACVYAPCYKINLVTGNSTLKHYYV